MAVKGNRVYLAYVAQRTGEARGLYFSLRVIGGDFFSTLGFTDLIERGTGTDGPRNPSLAVGDEGSLHGLHVAYDMTSSGGASHLLKYAYRQQQRTCTTGSDCEGEEICKDGVCGLDDSVCNDLTPCPEGFVCEDGACIEEGERDECATGADCGIEGEVCRDGMCVGPEGPECLADRDCPAGMRCVEEICVMIEGACNDDSNCGEREICRDNLCVTPDPPRNCSASNPCPEGQTCVEGVCVDLNINCLANSDCPENLVCNEAEARCVQKATKGSGGGCSLVK